LFERMADQKNLQPYKLSTFVLESSTGAPMSVDGDSITLKLEDEDIAFILGKRGITKQKLAKVSGARLDVDEKAFTLAISGPEDRRRCAHEYVDMVLAQRRGGAVKVDLTKKRDDLTVIYVPYDCVGYVTGANGKVLRTLEVEWGTLMFFLSSAAGYHYVGQEKTEALVIFGHRRGRMGSALKVMSAVEHKKKEGFFVKNQVFTADIMNDLDQDPNGFHMDQQVLQEADFSYALGREGKTRKKLAKASGCILEYVGFVAVMIGTKEERDRVKDYLRWLLMQRAGLCNVDIQGRTDVTVLDLEAKYVGWVTGVQGKNFRSIEDQTGVYLFTNKSGDLKAETDAIERIMIFAYDATCRERALKAILESVEEKKVADTHGSRLFRAPPPRDDRPNRRDSRPPRRRSHSPPRYRREEPPRFRDESPRRRGDVNAPQDRRRQASPAFRRREESPRRGRREDDRDRGREDDRDRDRADDRDRGRADERDRGRADERDRGRLDDRDRGRARQRSRGR